VTREEALQIFDELQEHRRKIALRSFVQLKFMKECEAFAESHGPFPEYTRLGDIMSDEQTSDLLVRACATVGIAREYYDHEVKDVREPSKAERAKYERALNVLGFTLELIEKAAADTIERLQGIGMSEDEIRALVRQGPASQ